MDDYKVHAPSKKAAQAITAAIKEAAEELGLTLNLKKCGTFTGNENSNTDSDDDDNVLGEEDIPFLPKVCEGYKYLVLIQLERDTALNSKKVEELVVEKCTEAIMTKLSPAQKITLLNTTVIPAATYITGNLYPNESRASTLKRCSDFDKSIRKILI